MELDLVWCFSSPTLYAHLSCSKPSHILSANQMVKMCIATTSRKTGSYSNYWACEFFAYYSAHLNDGISEVYGVFLLETLQTALSGADLYYWFGSGYGNMDHLSDPYASAFDVPIIGSMICASLIRLIISLCGMHKFPR